MATTNGVASADVRSGGKMMRSRRTAGFRTTPYDRPPAATSTAPGTDSPSHVSNWLSRFILSPSRFIANGAGKVLATVFGSDSTSASESSWDSSSEEDVDVISNADCFPDDVDPMIQEVNFATHTADNLQTFSWSTESKRKLAKLLALETFSREEGIALRRIIEARVAIPPAFRGVGPDELPSLHNTAVQEAKRWLERKKSDCISKLDVDTGHCTLNSFELPNVAETELISPVNIAKSYMEALPPWASPSGARMHGTTSFTGLQPSHDGSPHSRPKQSPLSGSWSLQEELRKVRFKSSEDMLRNRSPSTTDWSPFSLKHRIVASASMFDGVVPPNASNLGNNQYEGEIVHSEGREELNFSHRKTTPKSSISVTESDDHAAVRDSKNSCDNGTVSGLDANQDSRIREVNGELDGGPEVVSNGFLLAASGMSSGYGSKEASVPPDENHFGFNLDKDPKLHVADEPKFINDYRLDDGPSTDQKDIVGIPLQNSSNGKQVDRSLVGPPNSKRKSSDIAQKRTKRGGRYSRRGMRGD